MGNTIYEVHPELIVEWSERNSPLSPSDITYGSNKLVWWIGRCGHEWQASPKSRHAGENCPYWNAPSGISAMPSSIQSVVICSRHA